MFAIIYRLETSSKGGTMTPSLFACYLALKHRWIPLMIIHEKKKQHNTEYWSPAWAKPVLCLLRAFSIEVRHLAYNCMADIQFTISILSKCNLPFWAKLFTEYSNAYRKCDMNVNSDAKVQRWSTNSRLLWINIRVIGLDKILQLQKINRCLGKYKHATTIHKLGTNQFHRPSITNPKIFIVMCSNLNSLAIYINQDGRTKIRTQGNYPSTLYTHYICSTKWHWIQ